MLGRETDRSFGDLTPKCGRTDVHELLTGAAGGMTLGILAVVLWHVGRTRGDIARLERKVDAMLMQSGVDPAAVGRPS